MKAASALVAGHRPEPELAHAAVQAALATAGLERADNVILFLSRDFSRHPQPAVLAAARGAGCLSVSGCTASGLFTERGWQLGYLSSGRTMPHVPASSMPMRWLGRTAGRRIMLAPNFVCLDYRPAWYAPEACACSAKPRLSNVASIMN